MKKIALLILLIATSLVSFSQKVVKISGGITPARLNDSLSLFLRLTSLPTTANAVWYNNGSSVLSNDASFLWQSNTLFSPKFEATTTVDGGTPSAAFRINRTLTGANSGHGFRDQTIFNRDAGTAYNAYDAAVTFSGTTNKDHYAGFQDRWAYTASGNVDTMYSFVSIPSMTGTGTISNRVGFEAWDVAKTGGGFITNQYGLKVKQLSNATNNWAIYTEGNTRSYFGGNVGIGQTAPAVQFHVTSPILASASETDIMRLYGDADRGRFRVTNWGTVYIQQSNGSGGVLGEIYFAEPDNRIGMSFAPAGGTRFDQSALGDNWQIGRRVGGVTEEYIKMWSSDNVAIGLQGAKYDAKFASAVLNVGAINKGVLLPRLTTTQRNAISSPSHSLLVFNRTTNRYEYFDSIPNQWRTLITDIDTAGMGGGESGGVSSVAMTVPTGMAVSGSPITTSGTFGLTFQSGYQLLTNEYKDKIDSAYNRSSKSIYFRNGQTLGDSIFRKVNDSVSLFRRINIAAGSAKMVITPQHGADSLKYIFDVDETQITIGNIGGLLPHNKIATAPTLTLFGNNSGSTAAMVPIAAADARVMLGVNNAFNLTTGTLGTPLFAAGTIPINSIQSSGVTTNYIPKFNGTSIVWAADALQTDASGLTSGTLNAARLPSTAVQTTGSQTVEDKLIKKRITGTNTLDEGITEFIDLIPARDQQNVNFNASGIPSPGSIPVTATGSFLEGQEIKVSFEAQGVSGMTLSWDAADFVVEGSNGGLVLPTAYPTTGLTLTFQYRTALGKLLLISSSDPIVGSGGSPTTSASDLTSGTLNAARLPSTAVQTTGAQIIEQKRWIPRQDSTTSSATPTINTDNVDIYKLTAQTANITSFTTNLTGTPRHGEVLEIQITGTAARTITWGSSFVASTVALPTTTVTTATLTVVFQYYTTSSYGNNKWVCVNSY